jgi:hypothetical protein
MCMVKILHSTFSRPIIPVYGIPCTNNFCSDVFFFAFRCCWVNSSCFVCAGAQIPIICDTRISAENCWNYKPNNPTSTWSLGLDTTRGVSSIRWRLGSWQPYARLARAPSQCMSQIGLCGVITVYYGYYDWIWSLCLAKLYKQRPTGWAYPTHYFILLLYIQNGIITEKIWTCSVAVPKLVITGRTWEWAIWTTSLRPALR